MRRKLLYISLIFIAGIFASGCFFEAQDKKDVMLMIFALAAGFMGFSNLKEFRWRQIIAFAMGFCLFAISFFSFEDGAINNHVGSEERIEAEIISIKQKGSQRQYTLDIDSVGGEDCSKVLQKRFIISDKLGLMDTDEPIGATVTLVGVLEIPDRAANPRCFDYRKYLYSQGTGFSCNTFKVIEIRKSPKISDKVKNKVLQIKASFLGNLSGDGYALAEGILFGNSSSIDDDVLESFQKNGTAHVLAVSGLHIGILYTVYDFLQKKYRSKILTVAFLLFLYLYGVITMWPVSICRAELLIVLKLIADRLERPFDLATGLGFVASLVCINNPFSIYSISFQMSFLAVFILAVIERALERFMKKPLSGGITIQLALIPYMIYVFNYTSLVGIIANIPVIFLISIYVPLGVFAFLFFSFAGVFPMPLVGIIEGMGNMIARMNEIFYVEEVTSKEFTSGSAMAVIVIYIIIFFMASEQVNIEFIRRQYRQIVMRAVAVVAIGIMGAVSAASPFDDADMVFLDVGHGDSLHIKYEDFDVLIDGGGRENSNVAKKVLKPYFLKNGVKDIELAMGTSLNEEHYLGLFQLRNCFDVKESKIWCEAGEKIQGMNKGFIEVLWPIRADVKDFDGSLKGNVFKVHFDGVTCLVTGDLSTEGERKLVKYYENTHKLKSDILKVSNHGKDTSSSEEFIEAVSPRVAIISAGSQESQKPSDEVIEKFLKKDIILYMIDTAGAVGIDISGENFTVCTMEESMISKNLTRD